MVTYCCVKSCRNNSSEKRRSHRIFITFHAFPTNPEARSKWLKSIGRPSWDPPNHARVCSIHFSDDQINREHQRTRLKDDACPVRELPENSYFEATEMEVCRICLVTDVKMFSLQEEVLKICLKSVVGFNKDIEGLPQYACYECAFQLLKCYNLVEKSQIAKATLLNIFVKNGEVTKHLVKSINRSQLNLQSSLTHHNVVPKTILDIQYDEDLQKYMYTSQTEENICKREEKKTFQPEIVLTKKTANDNNSSKPRKHKIADVQDYKMEINLDLNAIENYKLEDTYLDNNAQLDNFVNVNDDVKGDIYHSDTDASEAYVPYTTELETEVKSDEDEPLINIKGMKQDLEKVKNGKKTPHKTKKKLSANKHPDGLTPDEVEMQQFFNIVILTLEEQIQDREKMKESPAYRDALYKCDICYKTYLHPNAFKMHLENHDPNRGKAECPVCKLRYKNEVLVKSHAYRTHGKKFYCKTCPKVFHNVRIAKKHQKRHEGYVYKCPLCSFSTVHDSAYGVHIRTQHPARHVCPHCGHTFVSERGLLLHTQRTHTHDVQIKETQSDSSMFRCKECDVRFTTEGAWRVHMLTSTQHKKKRNFCEPISIDDQLKSTCPRCGDQFATSKQLQDHNVQAHGKPAPKKMTWSLPGDSYPANCEHCGETVNNRKEHYFHVRKMHPKERESYQPVITAVCDTCGKGFQNSTKLHLHELRHKGVGTVRCPHCPRLFFDKYQLARHIGVHSDERPYACQLCDKAFKLRSNLDRHAKVHSGATPYECTMCGKRFRYSSSRNLHVRTVHYKMPHPPRKKRNSKQVRSVNSYENCV